MALTTEEVRKIAALARLRFSPEEEGMFVHQLGAIVDYIDQLQSYEADATFPPLPAGGRAMGEGGQGGEDRPHACLPRELFLGNAPAQAFGEFLVVPEVKGGGDDE
jgi:aspartyl-tRNA(Asn)/glutamyl-tRNA(Gln) amidotransferase subunit C